MKIETQTSDNRTLKLTVQVEDDQLQPALKAAARKLAKDYRIPGFRPGKAPYETVLRQLGENSIYQAALEDLTQTVYQAALAQEKVEPYAPGELEDVQLKPMVLTYSVPLAPEINLGDYRALRLPFEPPAVTDESVTERVEHLREHQAVVEPVERPAQLGDEVILDVSAFLNAGENPSDFLLADKDVAAVLDEKADWPMPGFASEVVGIAAGETRKFDLTFPADYANDSLKGQVAHFEVTAKEVKGRSLPEWSDDLAKALGDYESVDDLRAKVRADLQRQADRAVERDYADKVVDQLVAQAQIVYPPILLEQELDDYLADLDRRLHEQKLTLDDYLKIEGKTKEQLREETKPSAEGRLKRSLVLGKLVNLEGLTIAAEEVDQRVEMLSTPWGDRAGDMRKALASEDSRRMLAVDLLTDKAVARIIAVAKGEEVPAPAPIIEGEVHDYDHAHQPDENLSTVVDPEAAAPAEPAAGV
ncbi:MAG: trigger factor [Anaerolineales bacterium]|nr:trigger factor [Anaerolineales bacterium]